LKHLASALVKKIQHLSLTLAFLNSITCSRFNGYDLSFFWVCCRCL